MDVLGSLLEGFATEGPHEQEWHGRFKRADSVKVTVGKDHVRGRIVRFEDDTKMVIVAPEGGGPHVRAKVAQLAFETPAGQVKNQAEREAQQAQALAQARAGAPPKPGAPAGKPAAKPAGKVSEGIVVLLEAFAAAAPPPQSETPAQSQARGAQQVAAAKTALAAGWTAAKHPRGVGGKFAYSTGGKRATRSSAATQRTVGTGAQGSLVKSIQRQLGIPADGIYGPRTKAAVERYQRQHGLQVDGVVGRQTLAALRGHSSPSKVKPGPIAAKAATVRVHKSKRTRRMTNKNPWAPRKGQNRIAGGARV